MIYTQQNSNADSGRCGQAFNGVLYGGVSNKQYGTLTIGRQNSLQLDGIAAYDPMALSYAFSLLGYSGTNGGSGSTQAARWNNSAKYVYDYGPFMAGAMYSNGGSNSGMFGNGFGLMAGGHYGGFSAQVTYTREHGAVNLQTAVNDTLGSQTLAANISDNTTWSAMAKYTWQLGGGMPASYPTKAHMAEVPGDKFSIFAGYTHVDQANPSSPVLFGDAAGGYVLTSTATLPDNDAFTTDKVLQFFWAGAKYEWAWGLSVTGAYYHVNQNSYVADGAPCVAGGASKTDCSGNYDQVSLLADYVAEQAFRRLCRRHLRQGEQRSGIGLPGDAGRQVRLRGDGDQRRYGSLGDRIPRQDLKPADRQIEEALRGHPEGLDQEQPGSSTVLRITGYGRRSPDGLRGSAPPWCRQRGGRKLRNSARPAASSPCRRHGHPAGRPWRGPAARWLRRSGQSPATR